MTKKGEICISKKCISKMHFEKCISKKKIKIFIFSFCFDFDFSECVAFLKNISFLTVNDFHNL